MGDYQYAVSGLHIDATLNSGSLLITLAPESVRKIASFEIPLTVVSFGFSNVAEEEKQDFISYFDRRFQRGGG